MAPLLLQVFLTGQEEIETAYEMLKVSIVMDTMSACVGHVDQVALSSASVCSCDLVCVCVCVA